MDFTMDGQVNNTNRRRRAGLNIGVGERMVYWHTQDTTRMSMATCDMEFASFSMSYWHLPYFFDTARQERVCIL